MILGGKGLGGGGVGAKRQITVDFSLVQAFFPSHLRPYHTSDAAGMECCCVYLRKIIYVCSFSDGFPAGPWMLFDLTTTNSNEEAARVQRQPLSSVPGEAKRSREIDNSK
jgi:hypothetical protein